MLGDNIKTYRKNKGYSQETLAQELSVVRQTVSKWEKGHSVPDAEMLEKLAEILEVSVDDLLEKKTAVHYLNLISRLAIPLLKPLTTQPFTAPLTDMSMSGRSHMKGTEML